MAKLGENIISLQDEKLYRDRLGSLTQEVRHKLRPWPASPAPCSGLQHSDHPRGAVARLADWLQAVLQKNLVARARGAGCRLGLSVRQGQLDSPSAGDVPMRPPASSLPGGFLACPEPDLEGARPDDHPLRSCRAPAQGSQQACLACCGAGQ